MWRVLKLNEYPAAMNMAIDEAVAESVASGESLPTIRFYGWSPSAVSIGYFQSLLREVDIDECRKEGVDIVRRRTGGGAVYHEKELTYSVIGPVEMFPDGITESYHEICGWIIRSLARLGLESEFHPINDVLVGEKKISGNAQTRRNGVLQQHGTVIYDLDVDKMFSLLKVGDIKIKDKIIKNVKERVTSIVAHSDANLEQVYVAFLKGFTEDKKWEFGELSEKELSRAKELVKKYASKEWTEER